MHKEKAIQPLPQVDVELPNHSQMPPLGVTYSDGKRAMSVIYPQALQGLQPAQPKSSPSRSTSPRIDAAIAAGIMLTVSVSLALVLTGVSVVMEAMHSPREVIIHGR